MLALIISSNEAGAGCPLCCSTRRRVRASVLPRNASPTSSGVIGYPSEVRVSDIARSARASLSTITPSLSNTTSPQRAPAHLLDATSSGSCEPGSASTALPSGSGRMLSIWEQRTT